MGLRPLKQLLKIMSTLTSSEEIVVKFDEFRNDVIGVLSFTLAITALQFDRPSSVAFISLCFVITWAQLKIAPSRSDHEVFYKSLGRWKGHLRAVNSNLVMFFGIGFLALIAFGFLTLSDLAIFDISSLLKH